MEQGMTLYREAERRFAAGDRVQMTAPDRVGGIPVERPHSRLANTAISITATP
jgi:hypothetical protein